MVMRLVVFLLMCTEVGAWGGNTHRMLCSLALEVPGNDFKLKGQLNAIALQGVVAPDRRGPGWLPPIYHSYNPVFVPSPRRKWGNGKGPQVISKIANRILGRQLKDSALAFELGRLLHVTQDLCQPFHNGSGMSERQYHAAYERWVDKRLDILRYRIVAALREKAREVSSSSLSELGRVAARESREDYYELHKLCRRRPWGKDLEDLTVKRLVSAVVYSRAMLDEVIRRQTLSVENSPALDFFWALLFSLAIHLLTRSGRAKSEISHTTVF